MQRGLRTAAWVTVVVLGAACFWDPSPGSRYSEQQYVDLTDDDVVGVWVGHVSGATYTFAGDGTFEAAGVPTATFDDDAPFRIGGPIGPYRCRGSWHIATDRHLLVLDVISIRDERDAQPYAQPRGITFSATQWVSDPPDDPVKPLTLGLGADWMTEQ
ncbi:hypothetical protein ACFPIJ_43100 [Dactylosporangium cerinum]|uniref:Uncharacterized protein n=1 Tax=Dactylosporangium cerinum TaxID=1434730 RepID=A0ABV9W7A6_9ACTN